MFITASLRLKKTSKDSTLDFFQKKTFVFQNFEFLNSVVAYLQVCTGGGLALVEGGKLENPEKNPQS